MTPAERARAALPRREDLPGHGWRLDVDLELDPGGPGGSAGAGVSSMLPDCLPAGFPAPAVAAEADVSFTRPGRAVVVALSTVFAGRAAAVDAAAVLGSDAFVGCFAETVGHEVEAGRSIELLGPVTTGSAAGRSPQWRIVFAGADEEALRPAVLHVAVVHAGDVVVLVWVVDAGDDVDQQVWEHLVARVEARVARTPDR